MNNTYGFSVAMCVYNGDSPAFFDDALESVFNQTLCPNEVILQVDGPVNDSIQKIIEKYQNEYDFFKVFRLEKNSGHGIARNECIKHCSYNIVAIADSDDINRKDRFEKQIGIFMKYPDIDIVGSSNTTFIDTKSNIVSQNNRLEKHSDIINQLKKLSPITQASAMFKKDIYEKAGGYLDWYCAEDYYLWIRMYEAGARFYNCQEPLVNVRTSKDQYKRRGGWKYFKSVSKISKYMYDKKIIDFKTHIENVVPRFFLQVVMPSSVRGIIRNYYIRKKFK